MVFLFLGFPNLHEAGLAMMCVIACWYTVS